jgi:fructokinase
MSDPERPLVVGVGEILWDLLPAGPALGGAPANVACQARRLGAASALISAVGADPLGDRARHLLELLGIDDSAVARLDEHPTGTVLVEVGAGGEPRYQIAGNAAWDFIPATPAALRLARRADAMCFGTLASRETVSRTSIGQVIDAAPPACLRVLDVNLRPPWVHVDVLLELLERCHVLKVNASELEVLAETLDLEGEETEQVEELARLYSLRLVAVTRGDAGCHLFAAGRHEEHPGFAVREIVDTVGAGDAFTASLVLSMFRNLPLAAIAERCNRVASSVCQRTGASAAALTKIETTP